VTAAIAAERETDVRIGALELSSGATLPDAVQRVTLHGADPLPDGSNVAFAPHALTGSSRVADWWSGLIGPDALFDPARWCVVGINALGSCYGSSGPLSPAPDGRRWGPRFPLVSVADMVAAQRRALHALGIERLAVVIGGSLGGFQALHWARAHSDEVEHAVVVGAYDHLRAQAIAQNANARDAIALDPAFRRGWYAAAPREGLRLARAIATLTYKSEALFERRFANRPDRRGAERFDVEGYLAYQGERFAERIDANAYVALTRAMDRFDLRGRERPAGATRLTFVGIEGDQLFGPAHVRACAARWREAGWNAVYREQRSDHGHDAFLAEAETLGALLQAAG
jgi:homoserine O-acetyltransferase